MAPRWVFPVWLVRLLHFLGMTNLTDAEVEEYIRVRREYERARKQKPP